MIWTRSWPALMVGVAMLAGVLPASAQQAEPPPPLPATPNLDACPRQSWVAGSVELCDGTLVYRDYLYDDYGADTGSFNAGSTGSIAVPAGDIRYSEDVNSADLVDLALSVEGNTLKVVAEVNALFNADSTVVAIAIDTDDDAATGGGEWEDLGVSSAGWDMLHTFSQGDPETNLITGSVALPAGNRWRVQAVTAVKDGPVMNVAFRGTDEEAARPIFPAVRPDSSSVGAWWEDRQSRALRAGDISEFGHTVDVADLRGGVTRAAPPVKGFHQRVYTSAYTLPPGEGMSYSGYQGRGTGGAAPAFAQIFHFYGKYQPYGMYIPDQPAPHGLQLLLHGSNAGHASLVNQPGAQQVIGEEHNRILVVPLARGPHGYGSDISERDELDVLADVLANHKVDRDRIFVSGYSQGGYTAFRMSMLYPHLFAGVVSWVGFTGDAGNGTPAEGEGAVTAGAVGNMIDFVRNVRHVPTALMYGGTDELVHVSSSNAMAQQFRDLGNPYIYYLHHSADHFTFALADDWRKETAWTAELTRVRNPARVTFRTADFLGNPAYKIRHDRAYWVSQIRGRDDAYIDVDVASGGCGVEEVTEEGVTAGPDPVPWHADFRNRTATEPVAATPRLDATLTNVRALTIDTRDACLAEAFPYKVVTDGAVGLRFSDGRILELTEAGTYEGVLAAPSPVSIADACPPDDVPRSGFRDVRRNTHRDAIDCLAWYGIARGSSDTSYAPASAVTRGQMASFVVRTLREAGVDLARPQRDRFSDSDGSVHHRAIERLAAAGLVEGVSRKRFAPDRAVTRAQMATFLVHGFYPDGAQPAVGYPDAFDDDNDSVHEHNINAAAGLGFTAGVAPRRYDPEADVRRDQMASFVARLLNGWAERDAVAPPR